MFKQLATTLFAILVAACAAGEPTAERSTVANADPVAVQAPAASPVAGDWRTRVRVHLEELRASNPTLASELAQLEPSRTRAGFLRFTSRALHDPHAAAVFLDRLTSGRESEAVRAALVEALPRTGGLFADAVTELITTESAASVRTAYVHSLRHAPADQAIPVLERALADGDVAVSTQAVHTLAGHPDGARAAAALGAALASPDAGMRAATARALGVLQVATAQDALLDRLADPAADVRLEALRALDRIAPGSMKNHAALSTMRADADPRIVQLVARLAGDTATTAP